MKAGNKLYIEGGPGGWSPLGEIDNSFWDRMCRCHTTPQGHGVQVQNGTEYFLNPEKPGYLTTKKQKAMRTDVELLQALRDTMMNSIDFNGLCGLKSIVAENDKEEIRLRELIRKMKPTNIEKRGIYYWQPGDRLSRYSAIQKLIINLSGVGKTPVEEEKWELIKEIDTPRTSYCTGNTFTKREILQLFDVEHPEKYPQWFKEIKKEKTLQDYEDEFVPTYYNEPHKWLKKAHPKQYYSIILQRIADNLCDKGIVRRYFITSISFQGILCEDKIEVQKMQINSYKNHSPIGSITFDKKENAYKAIEIMGNKLNALF